MGDILEKRVIAASRVVVVMPGWLGDAVMGTAFLRGLRELYKDARVCAVARGEAVGAVCEGLVDEVKVYGKGGEREVVRWMRSQKFELGILLPNSFRSAWMLWRGGVRRRLGYARGGRPWLLTDRVFAQKRTAEGREVDRGRARAIAEMGGGRVRVGSGYEPLPAIEYYLEMLRYLRGEGGNDECRMTNDESNLNGGNEGMTKRGGERRMELRIGEAEQEEGVEALRELGVWGNDECRMTNDESNSKGGNERMTKRDGGRPPEGGTTNREGMTKRGAGYAVVVPGANFGGSKCWEVGRYAELARRLADPLGEFGVKVVLVGTPAERGILEGIMKEVGRNDDDGQSGDWRSQGGRRVVSILEVNGGKGVGVGGLKEVVRGARVMVCNDTGPRHMAVAFGVPVVTLFGPTEERWAETFYERERIVRVEVPCGPCQLKVCPVDHRCMKGITVEMVVGKVREVWRGGND